MIIVMRPQAGETDIQTVIGKLEKIDGVQYQLIKGQVQTVIGLVGDTHNVDRQMLAIQPNVENVLKVQEPFKKANRKFHPDSTVIDMSGARIGGGHFAVMAGPCSVESKEQIVGIARDIKKSGANLLRGGAFKPRTSPYAFQGLAEEGLDLLDAARKETGLPIVSELMSAKHLQAFDDLVDVIQIGARNMQNFDLLKEVGKLNKPILLKRGLSSTIEEWLMSAEYILAQGNEQVILCERGIRTFETYTRNTLDISAIAAVKELSHLPIVIDPSHASGRSEMVESLALAATIAGADGLMIEVHNDPLNAWSDGRQSVTPAAFDSIMKKVNCVRDCVLSFDK